jgi:formylglycine-generating enzyme required for sulfatase activity/serine/threonine protein kinase
VKSCPTCSRTYADDIEFCPHDATRLAGAGTAAEEQLAAGLARRFRIMRRLGAGGMGTVFLAEQVGVGNRLVALKVLSRKLLDDPEFLLRFQNEAASTGCIDHPNVVTIYESGQADDGTPYIAMKYLEGETLHQVLKARGALPVAECAEILQQAARGLNAAHRLGIIHRDLKPDNIFLTKDDEGGLVVKVVDFGIAKLRESATHTLTGTVLGTPAYMSFEQASGMRSDELDARSDIYSLGMVVYEMLTGRLPFESDTPVGYLRKHLQDAPPPFRALKPDLPALPEVEAVVMKALAKDRDRRHGSVLDFAREFGRAASAQAPSDELRATVKVAERRDGIHAEQGRLAGEKEEQERREKERAEAKRLAREQVEAKRHPTERAKAAPQRTSRAKYAVLGLIGLALLAGTIWYVLPRRNQRQQAVEPWKPGLAAGGVAVNPKDGLKYVGIPPGTFMMGCSPGDGECHVDEMPAHQVTITRGFWIGQTLVTVRAYRRFVGATGRQMPVAPEVDKGENVPMVLVSWDDAQAYCGWTGGRLPTEAEWEYAARGGSSASRYGNLDDIAWYDGNSGGHTHDVAQMRPNGFGLYDMLGNVWEWVNDWYDEHYYRNGPSQDPQGPASGRQRVLRGGDWGGGPRDVRVSNRNRFNTDYSNVYSGFRCAGEVVNP